MSSIATAEVSPPDGGRMGDAPTVDDEPQPVNYEGGYDRESATGVLSKIFNFQSFRPGQFEAIERVLNKKSTLAGTCRLMVIQRSSLIFVRVASPAYWRRKVADIPNACVHAPWNNHCRYAVTCFNARPPFTTASLPSWCHLVQRAICCCD